MSPLTSAPSNPLRVTAVGESELVNHGLARMLEPYADRVQLVGSSATGGPRRHVDITLHDSLADVSVGSVMGMQPPVSYEGALVAWSWNVRPGLRDLVLSHGARGYLAKSLPASTLVAALEDIHRGEVVVAADRTRLPHEGVPLTPRESQIVSLVTRGLDNMTIADDLCLSINSIKTYIRAAYRKMGVTTRSQAVLWGVRNGYLDDPGASVA